MRAEVKEMKCWFAVLLRLSRITEYTVLAVGNCVVLLRLSEISLCCCSCREVCRVFTAVNDVMMSTAFIKFDVIIAKAVGSFVVLLRLSGNFPGLLQLLGISRCCYGCRGFHRVATAVGNFMEFRSACYSCREFGRVASNTFSCCREFGRVAKTVENFAV